MSSTPAPSRRACKPANPLNAAPGLHGPLLARKGEAHAPVIPLNFQRSSPGPAPGYHEDQDSMKSSTTLMLISLMLGACSQGPQGPTGAQGPEGPMGPAGPTGPAGAPGAGWAARDPHIVTTNSGNVGIDQDQPAAKLDVNGNVNATGYLLAGAEVVQMRRSGMFTDVARNAHVTITGGTLQAGGPTNEMAEGSSWRTTVFPSSMTVDFGQQRLHIFQVAWESFVRTDARWIPEYQGPGAYVLEYSQDGSTWTQIPSVAPIDGDVFAHPVSIVEPSPWIRYLKLTVRAPRIPGNPVHITMFRALSWVPGDSSAIDVRRVVSVPGTGPTRVWAEGRPGTARWGTTGIESGLCTNGDVKFGLSSSRVWWEGSAAACPTGTWVCTRAERGSAPCDTARPDTTCDYLTRTGTCGDYAPSTHWGHVADNGYQNGVEGVVICEDGASGTGGGGNYSMPAWCCSH